MWVGLGDIDPQLVIQAYREILNRDPNQGEIDFQKVHFGPGDYDFLKRNLTLSEEYQKTRGITVLNPGGSWLKAPTNNPNANVVYVTTQTETDTTTGDKVDAAIDSVNTTVQDWLAEIGVPETIFGVDSMYVIGGGAAALLALGMLGKRGRW